ncbi:uncharacterized protein IAS62_004854 [Cryptococcus decagattii]|uniref:Uncharacterized protein n=1 Tax=Cryptococcus decagattii TaxID=1859122 RepID=A0ABZ2AYK4_9TREE
MTTYKTEGNLLFSLFECCALSHNSRNQRINILSENPVVANISPAAMAVKTPEDRRRRHEWRAYQSSTEG